MLSKAVSINVAVRFRPVSDPWASTYNLDGTVDTLPFATRAKQITNKVMSAKELQLQLTVLKKQLSDEQAANLQMDTEKTSLLEEVEGLRAIKAQNETSAAELGDKYKAMEQKHSSLVEQMKEPEAPNAMVQLNALSEMWCLMDSHGEQMESRNNEMGQCEKRTAAQMQQMQSSLDAKDQAVDGLNVEITALKRSVLELKLQRNMLATANVMRSDRPESKEGAVAPSLSTKDDLNSIIAEHALQIEALKSENERLKEDRARLMEWNEELRKDSEDLALMVVGRFAPNGSSDDANDRAFNASESMMSHIMRRSAALFESVFGKASELASQQWNGDWNGRRTGMFHSGHYGGNN